jgi:hypothetical protein
MSMNENLCSVETPPRVFSPKRQKMEPEITVKIEYFQDNVNKEHFHLYPSNYLQLSNQLR